MIFTKEEREQLYYCVGCRIGIIETGEPMLRANDAINMGKLKMIRALSKEQRALICMLEDIQIRLLNNKE